MFDTTSQKFLLIEVREVYGVAKAYPLNRAAELFAEIAGTKTIGRRTLEKAEALGFEIVSSARADWRKAA